MSSLPTCASSIWTACAPASPPGRSFPTGSHGGRFAAMERSQPVGAGSIPTTNTVVIVVKVDGPPSSLAALDGTITEAVAWPRRDSPPRGFAPWYTTASLAVSACANVEEVQRMLAHASAAMTLDLYADLFDVD